MFYMAYYETPTKGPVMDLKSKLTKTKNKIKQHAPEIAVIGSSVAALTYLAVTAYKEIQKVGQDIIILTPTPTTTVVSESGAGSVRLLTGEDRDKILSDETLELREVVGDDFYFMSHPDSED
jgi:hypothetical protein